MNHRMIAACAQLKNWQMRWPCSVPLQEVTSLKLLGNHGYINQPVAQQYISTWPLFTASLPGRPHFFGLHMTSFFVALPFHTLLSTQIFKSGKLTDKGRPRNEASHVTRIIKCWLLPHCPDEIVHQFSSAILVTNLSVSSLSLFLSS